MQQPAHMHPPLHTSHHCERVRKCCSILHESVHVPAILEERCKVRVHVGDGREDEHVQHRRNIGPQASLREALTLASAPMAACCRPEDEADGAWPTVKRTVPAVATPQPSQTEQPGRSPARDDRVGVTKDVTCTPQYCFC